MELQTVWHGALWRDDRPLPAPQREPVVIERFNTYEARCARFPRIHQAVAQALTEWRTVADLARAANCSNADVYVALQRLRRQGRVEVVVKFALGL